MASWVTQEPTELQKLVEQAAKAARLPLRRLMRKAGLSAQSLAYWRKGERVPEPDSMARVGQSLILQGDTLKSLGERFLEVVEAEEAGRREGRIESPPGENLQLFAADVPTHLSS